MNETARVLLEYLGNPGNWFSIGSLFISLTWLIIYDAVWSWAFKNNQSSWWFERAQRWLKGTFYFGSYALFLIMIFVPVPFNLFITLFIISAATSLTVWIRREQDKKIKNIEKEQKEKENEAKRII